MDDKLKLAPWTIGAVMAILLLPTAQAAHVVNACGHQDYPPWNWLSQGKIKGVCAQVVQELFEQQGIEVDFSYVGPWARCQRNIGKGLVDINICAFINPVRESYSTFIDTPMGHNDQVVLVHHLRTFQFEKWQDLKGKLAGMVLGVSIGEAFDTFLNEHAAIFRVRDPAQSLKMLQSGRVDFVPMGRFSARILIEMMGLENEILILPTPILVGNLHISISNHSNLHHLLPAIEEAMQSERYRQRVNQLLNEYTQAYLEEWRQVPSAE